MYLLASFNLSSRSVLVHICVPLCVCKAVLHRCRPIIVFYTEYSETLSNYTPNCRGLNIRPSTLSGSAIYEASDERCTPWCNQRARLILEVVQTREEKLCMFSGLVQGKLRKVIHNTFTIHLVILAVLHAIIAAIKWPQLIIFKQAWGHNEEEENRGNSFNSCEGMNWTASAVKWGN